MYVFGVVGATECVLGKRVSAAVFRVWGVACIGRKKIMETWWGHKALAPESLVFGMCQSKSANKKKTQGKVGGP